MHLKWIRLESGDRRTSGKRKYYGHHLCSYSLEIKSVDTKSIKMEKIKNKFSSILYPPGVTRLEPRVTTALFLILFSTQLTLTTPFSYLPAMVTSFGYTDRDRGYYAGIIASSLFVGRFFGGYFWGWLTDKIGRRPVLLISACLTYSATVAFGFSTSLTSAIVTRFLQGLFNGVIVVGRAAFSEICDETNQAIGVSLVFAAWNSAIVLGPALGGFLAEPVKKYPSSFSGAAEKFFKKFAYLMPSILISLILLLSILLIYFTFEETLKSKNASVTEEKPLLEEENTFCMTEDAAFKNKEEVDAHKEEEAVAVVEEKDSTAQTCCSSVRTWSIWKLLRDKYVILVTVMFGISGFCIIGFAELRSLWMATNKKYGGLSFSTDRIGIALLVPAIVAVVVQPIMFSRMEKRLGGIWTLRLTLAILMLCTASFPFVHETVNNKPWLWFCLVVIGVLRMVSDISSRSCIALFINNVVHVDQAGRANGLAFSVQEIMRVASPTLFGSLFAWAINYKKHTAVFPLDYRLPFFGLAFSVLVILLLSLLLPKRINSPKVVMEI